MSQEFQVTCVHKTNRSSAHERIHSLGGPAGGGWKRSQEQVILRIESGQCRFYTVDSHRQKVYLIVATSPYGRKYVKTTADGEHPDNLLSLLECR